MNIKKLSWKFIFLKVPWTFIALVWILTILLLCSHTNGFSETLENVPKFHSIQMNAKRWFYFSLFGKLHWQARCSSKLSYFSSVQETIVLTVGWVSQGAWLAGVGELRPEWLLVTVVQLGMRVLPKHHLHETLGCTQPTFCSTDASSWWRRPCPTGWATRSCWWPALGPGCTGGHWSWVHSTSHYWAIISPPVGYTGCLLTLAGGQVGPPLLPTHSLSCRVVPAKATSTPAGSMMEGALTYGRAGSQVTVEESACSRGRSHLEKAGAARGAQRQANSNGRRREAAGWAGRTTSEPVAPSWRHFEASSLVSSYTSFFLRAAPDDLSDLSTPLPPPLHIYSFL